MAVKPPWPLVGREAELAAFTRILGDDAHRGVIVCGPQGVGKTRLAEEMLAHAVMAGFRAGRAAASAAASSVALGALAHLLPAGVDLSDAVTRFRALAKALTGRQGDRWAFLIDDAHLLDPASAMLLRQLMDARAVLLIATIATGEARTRTPTADALLHADAAVRFDLTPLSDEAVEEVLTRTLERPPAKRVCYALAAASGGNPLYLRELTIGALDSRALLSDGDLTELWEVGQYLGTPKLTELIEQRLAAAGPASRTALELLALCAPVPLVDLDGTAPLEVLASLEAAGLITVAQDGRRTQVSLAHPLYGQVLRAKVPALRSRRILLRQTERTLARGRRRADDALRMAVWQLTATGRADAGLLGEGAATALRAFDYCQALPLLTALPPAEHSTRTRLLLAQTRFMCGDSQGAEQSLADADAHAATEAERVAVTLLRTTNLLHDGRPPTEVLSHNTLVRSQVTSPGGGADLEMNEGSILIASGRPHEGLALLSGLEPALERHRSRDIWLHHASFLPFGLAMVGRTLEAVAWAHDAHTVHLSDPAVPASHPSARLRAVVMALTEAGRLSEAARVGEKAFADLVAAGVLHSRVWLATLLGRTHWLAGRAQSARQWYREAITAARRMDHLGARRVALSGMAAACAVTGDFPAAEAALAELATVRMEQGTSLGMLSAGEEELGAAWLAAMRGDLARARTRLRAAARIARASGHASSEALLLTDIARLGGAKDVAAPLAALSDRCDGALAPARSQFAAALANDDPEQLIAAAARLEAVGTMVLSAEAATAACAVLRRHALHRRAAAAMASAEMALTHCQSVTTPVLATAIGTRSLTSREREVALLAASGATSKSIASSLTLSVRTVDNHLQRAYTKLGITSRHELAALLVARFAARSAPIEGCSS
ncbi:LuxR C-terminal-related transcriptional regulator [Streptomyces sp. NPDC002742]|uniref:helix-turn-helix transcriptional regulator n=1 Tax=Streptomyces sp. NPDC002742 TaxID=3364663 RepID=UPI0036753381